MTEKHKMSLTMRIFLGLVLGLVVGFMLKLFNEAVPLINLGFVEFSLRDQLASLFHVGGKIFVNCLKMMVVPLVFVSLVVGICSLSDTTKLGRLGTKAISLYIITTAIAITIAISLALIISPGEGANLVQTQEQASKEAPTLGQVIIDMFPSNPVAAMAEGKMLQIIVFAVLFGIAMVTCGDAGKRIFTIFEDLNTINLRLVTILMNLAPYGVFCLVAKLAATIEFSTFEKLLVYFFTVLGALAIHALVTYPSIMTVLSGLNPVGFLIKMKNNFLFAFSTSSSSATLPVTLETATYKLGVKNSVSSFTIPLGATINMDGTAIMQGVATVFIAQAYNIDLTVTDYLMVILTATLASIGTAGVPGVGLIMLGMVLQQVNLPLEAIGLILGVDRLLDMTRTGVNVIGDCMVSCVVAKSEGEFDKEVFDDPEAGVALENKAIESKA